MKTWLCVCGLASQFLLAQCGLAAASTITGAGSTFVYPVLSLWTKEYAKKHHQQINYQGVGSSAGMNQLERETVDFAASDKPQKMKKLRAKDWLQIPVAISGIVLITHLAGIENNQLTLDGPTLASIYLGQIVYWDDARIKAQNRELILPHTRIITVHRADGSGTSFNFTHYLSQVSPTWESQVGFGTTVRWPSRYALGAKGNGGVASQVKLTANSIGYVEYAYAEQEKLPMVRLKNRERQVVTASLKSFSSAAQHANWRKEAGYYLLLTNQPGANSWPIVAASFVLIPKHSLYYTELVKFFTWGGRHGAAAAKQLGYVVAPQKIFDQISNQPV